MVAGDLDRSVREWVVRLCTVRLSDELCGSYLESSAVRKLRANASSVIPAIVQIKEERSVLRRGCVLGA